jgi:hypothetical protein
LRRVHQELPERKVLTLYAAAKLADKSTGLGLRYLNSGVAEQFLGMLDQRLGA